MPPPTPVSDHIFSINIPSVWKHDDDNVPPVLEWDDLFEESLLLIDLYPLVHLSMGEFMGVPTVPSTPVHCIERDVNDWALLRVVRIRTLLVMRTCDGRPKRSQMGEDRGKWQ